MDHRLNMSLQCDAAVKQMDVVLGCINKGIRCKTWEVIIPVYFASIVYLAMA